MNFFLPENRNERAYSHAQQPVNINLFKLKSKVIPEINKFSLKNFHIKNFNRKILVDAHKIIFAASKSDFGGVFKSVNSVS